MAIALLQAVSTAAANGSASVNVSPTLTAGSLLVVQVKFRNTTSSDTDATISDTAGNTFAVANRTVRFGGDPCTIQTWYVASCISGSTTITVTRPTTNQSILITAAEYSGGAASPYVDSAGGDQYTTSWSTGSISVPDGALLFGGIARTTNNGASITPNGAWSTLSNDNANYPACVTSHRVGVAAGSYNFSGTASGATQCNSAIVAFAPLLVPEQPQDVETLLLNGTDTYTWDDGDLGFNGPTGDEALKYDSGEWKLYDSAGSLIETYSGGNYNTLPDLSEHDDTYVWSEPKDDSGDWVYGIVGIVYPAPDGLAKCTLTFTATEYPAVWNGWNGYILPSAGNYLALWDNGSVWQSFNATTAFASRGTNNARVAIETWPWSHSGEDWSDPLTADDQPWPLGGRRFNRTLMGAGL